MFDPRCSIFMDPGVRDAQLHAPRPSNPQHRRGAVSIIAMMFLVIFSALATAMAIVAQGNLATADSQLKINRSLAAAETGLAFIQNRLDAVSADVKTTDGLIDGSNAPALWDDIVARLLDPADPNTLAGATHNSVEPYLLDGTLYLGPIHVGTGDNARFRAELTRHPIPGEDYTTGLYRLPGYVAMWSHHVEQAAGKSLDACTDEEITAALASWTMPAQYVRVKVIGEDGPTANPIRRAISVDMKIVKTTRFALLSRSRIMIGRNVMIDGPVGSRFLDVDLTNGHPVQMESDFRGLHANLDDDLDALYATLAQIVDPANDTQRDRDNDNRIYLYGPEGEGLADPVSGLVDINNDGQPDDRNGDGFLDEWDFFLTRADADFSQTITVGELQSLAVDDVAAEQLHTLIDTFGDPARIGLGDGLLDEQDLYTKVRGEIKIRAALESWLTGAAEGTYQDYFQGPIAPDKGGNALTFQSSDTEVHSFSASDFDTSSFATLASGDLIAQAVANDPSFNINNEVASEEVPFGAAHPYDYYDRPVFRNMTFTNVTIPKGLNALFENCTFIGVTFVDTAVDNADADYNYAGMTQEDGSLKHPTAVAMVDGVEVSNTKSVANNVRFNDCTFEGSVVTPAPTQFTHVRNKITFTGTTEFNIRNSVNLTDAQKSLYERSAVLAPHMSVEMGSFAAPADPGETVELTGTIVAGVMDIRGQAKITGSIVTTFEPTAGVAPVVGNTSPQYNTTLGYFSSEAGDLEAELPNSGLGRIQLRYDPSIPMPDGILGPVALEQDRDLYYEVKP